jgi:hypothetical protein
MAKLALPAAAASAALASSKLLLYRSFISALFPNPGAPVPPLVPSAKIFKWRLVFFSLFYIRKVKLF